MDSWKIYNGDCCEIMPQLPDGCVDFSIFSPPFSNLYVYSDSDRDMGNCSTDAEFFAHFAYMVRELFRMTRNGRLAAVHCIDMPLRKTLDGVTGLKDFPGQIIDCFEKCGWTYHSRVTIWKDPVVEMQRTKAMGLLHKTIRTDSSKCRQGCADYLVVFRKNAAEGEIRPVSRPDGFNPAEYVGENRADCVTSIDVWQRYASPVWFDIRQTNVLQANRKFNEKDEKHICPLQLDVIERAIHLWTNEGDVVFSPFAGIGSEIYSAVKMKRKGLGIELKPEYYRQAMKNLTMLSHDMSRSLLDLT